MNFNIYNSLVLAGIIQGFLFSAVVLSIKKFRTKGSIFLIGLIFIYSLSMLMYILADVGVVSLIDMYAYMYLPFAAAIPPLFYIYVLFFLDKNRKINNTKKILFLPFIILSIGTLYCRIVYLTGIQTNPMSSVYLFIIRATEIFSSIFCVVLLILAFRKIVTYEKNNQGFNISTIKLNLNWLKITIVIMFILTLEWIRLTYINIFIPNKTPTFYSLWIGMTGIIYWLGHIGIYKFGILEERHKIRQNILLTTKNGNSSYNNKHVQEFKRLINEEKLFLDYSLSLESIAKKMGLSSGHLSRIIKSELNASFTDYVNNLRVNEAKHYLKNPEFSNYTITAIGLEAGFNSKSTFHDVFKKLTGVTPLRFKKQA